MTAHADDDAIGSFPQEFGLVGVKFEVEDAFGELNGIIAYLLIP